MCCMRRGPFRARTWEWRKRERSKESTMPQLAAKQARPVRGCVFPAASLCVLCADSRWPSRPLVGCWLDDSAHRRGMQPRTRGSLGPRLVLPFSLQGGVKRCCRNRQVANWRRAQNPCRPPPQSGSSHYLGVTWSPSCSQTLGSLWS